MKKYFEGVSNIEELKKAWKNLCKKHHPDLGGKVEVMQDINNEYDELFEELKNGYNETHEKKVTEAPAEYREVMVKIINLVGVEAELCGSWLWLSGNTKPNKESIKAAGFKWSKPKNMWYWYPGEATSCFYRGKKDIDSIRKTYGSERVTLKPEPCLT